MTYKELERNGKSAKGKMYLLKYFNKDKLTFREACIAKCYECMGMYIDGKVDCGIKDCPLYPFMPFRKGTKQAMRKMSDKQKKKISLNLHKKTDSNTVASHNNA